MKSANANVPPASIYPVAGSRSARSHSSTGARNTAGSRLVGTSQNPRPPSARCSSALRRSGIRMRAAARIPVALFLLR